VVEAAAQGGGGGGGRGGMSGLCAFFNTRKGCRNGDDCDFEHVPGPREMGGGICVFFNTPQVGRGRCRWTLGSQHLTLLVLSTLETNT